jgi:hypothetical protein
LEDRERKLGSIKPPLVIREANGAEFLMDHCKFAGELACKNAANPRNGRASMAFFIIRAHPSNPWFLMLFFIA